MAQARGVSRAHRLGFVAALAIVAGCGYRRDGDLAAAMPADAVVVAQARTDRLRATPLWRASPPELVESFSQASVVAAAYAQGAWLVLAGGTFGQAPPGARMVAPHLACAGPDGLAAAAIARWRTQAQPGPLAAFAAAHASGSPLWITLRGGADLPLSGNGANLNRLFRDVEYASLDVRVDGACRLHLAAESSTDAAARRFEETLRAMLSLAALEEARRPALAGALNGAVVRREARAIEAELTGSIETVAALVGDRPR